MYKLDNKLRNINHHPNIFPYLRLIVDPRSVVLTISDFTPIKVSFLGLGLGLGLGLYIRIISIYIHQYWNTDPVAAAVDIIIIFIVIIIIIIEDVHS